MRPRIVGSAPKRRVHSPWLITATGCAVAGSVSSGRKMRPRSGRAPTTSKIVELTKAPVTRSGSASPTRVTLCCRATAISSKERDWARQSRYSGQAAALWPLPVVVQTSTSRSAAG